MNYQESPFPVDGTAHHVVCRFNIRNGTVRHITTQSIDIFDGIA